MIDDLRLHDPYLLLLLLLIPLLFAWERWRAWHAPTVTYTNVALLRGPSGFRTRLRWLPSLLRGIALVLLGIAIARPQAGEAEAIAPTEGIDIALAIDVSASMSLEDFGGSSRLEGAQQVASEFVAARDTDRVALVAFRRQSEVLSPLTIDYNAIQELIARSDEVLVEDGTGIGIAIAESANLLRDSRAASRIIILVTDGENNEPSLPPADAARIAEALNIRLYIIGILAQVQSAIVEPVNAEALTAIAEPTGGRYYSARDPQALANVYDEIATLEKSRIDDTRFTRYDELAWLLIVPALGLLGVELALRSTLLRRLP
jgi:Ca-activated chloride channel homolog